MKPIRNILVFGATSEIAQAIIRDYVVNPFYQTRIYLIARNQSKLQSISSDLQVRGSEKVYTEISDLDDCSQHQQLIDNAKAKFTEDIDIAIIAHGVLPDQLELNGNIDLALANFHTNAVSVISLMMRLANLFEKQGLGRLAVIGSVAGDRGRAQTTTYGSAKTAIERTAEALNSRFFGRPISCTLIKPGLTKTAMTAHMKQEGFLWATPEEIAPQIIRAIDSRKEVVFSPWKWRLIMFVVVHLPSYVIKKLKI